MQLSAPRIYIIERNVTTEAGIFVARFEVTEIAGSYKARLIEMMPVASIKTLSSEMMLLESPHIIERPVYYFNRPTKTTSPFFDLFTFFVSQPTRAPDLM